ncbi:AraC family transcriptional regulator [Paraburkholderia eburnea]|uniref:AraC family transcriptional regulator n=1 Tax=Paraburkholderia eburnea TaxID=1189126 RepID=A0A2S4LV18_9BURK|nr:helix-turn-helix transcriptional regulator [Paraburkholderia eburnea]POR46301.1 AraC family transcriptional regulator [Paraburkholderia eburnea]PRZ16254.1 AraC family transcriptional regulator [Paraburkholderia eburnea]
MKGSLFQHYPRQRQPLARTAIGIAIEYRHGEREAWHQHQHGQLVFAARGVVRVLTPSRTWTLPPSRAAWLPSNVDHELHSVGESELCSVWVEPEAVPWQWTAPAVIAATPLVRELALTLSEGGETYAPDSRAALAAPLLLNVLAGLPALPEAGVPLPGDERLAQICEHMMNDPGSTLTLAFWGEHFGASGRTLERKFKSETGLSFGVWRQQMRVAESITRLALGEPVQRIARDFGYSTASAFIAMFRQITGESPQRYLASK